VISRGGKKGGRQQKGEKEKRDRIIDQGVGVREDLIIFRVSLGKDTTGKGKEWGKKKEKGAIGELGGDLLNNLSLNLVRTRERKKRKRREKERKKENPGSRYSTNASFNYPS